MEAPLMVASYRSPQMGGPWDPREASTAWRWTAFLLAPIIWTVPALILSFFVAVFTGLILIPHFWPAAPFVTLMLLYLVNRAFAKSRERNGRVILNYLETAVRLNLPLTSFLIAAEASETGRRRRQLRRLREHLEAGLPVAAAMQVVPDLSEAHVRTIAVYESLGQLKIGLTRMEESARRKDIDFAERSDAALYRFYPPFLLLFMTAVMIFLMIFIIPKFREIFKDFKTPLPWATEKLMAISSFITDSPLILFPFLGVMILLLIGPMSVYMQRIFLPSWPEPKFAGMWAWVRWRLPFFRGMEQDAAMGATCEVLAEALEAGVPFPVAVRESAALPINPGFQRRLVDFRRRLQSGQPTPDAARQAGLPALLVGFLAPLSLHGVGVSASALFGFLARYYRQKFSRGIIFMRAAAGPIVTLIMGSLVLGVLYSVFSALVRLLEITMKGSGNLL